jgi:hypothetical protein
MAATMFIFEEFSYARQSYGKDRIAFTVVPLMLNTKREKELRCYTDAHPGFDAPADWLIIFTHNYTGENVGYFVVPACTPCLVEIQLINTGGE